jgi:hypothetical protein
MRRRSVLFLNGPRRTRVVAGSIAPGLALAGRWTPPFGFGASSPVRLATWDVYVAITNQKRARTPCNFRRSTRSSILVDGLPSTMRAKRLERPPDAADADVAVTEHLRRIIERALRAVPEAERRSVVL